MKNNVHLRNAAFRSRAASRSSFDPSSSERTTLELSPPSPPLLGAFLVLGGIACVEPREKIVNAWWLAPRTK